MISSADTYNLTGTLDGLTLLDQSVGTEKHNTDLAGFEVGSEVTSLLIVVLFGIGTDYILFFLFRYRERMREGEEHRSAVAHALERAGEAIASAGAAVTQAIPRAMSPHRSPSISAPDSSEDGT